ncbi:hypothetical protein AO1008_07566 [Aspergillus oryzae 100-8]|uniref:Mitochondrial distribution and morphology protein 12 n=1 Tax=Aspergillus oryzae (strain 3.042) TaxID=1160506 RepID=I8A8C9_ASPO3|nr:hypothetical protein Ao3042_02455 [Aspergillus oryzae 3.042]KDE81111.1 hypothetical protein AO1008_07566 [Aspergillus oryzae 100-8]|eukprot:EIT81089.1 hypothetical protein Ao3042_02455 [Aspergillus oryzae 3.042]
MSIEVDWRAATSGPDGEALAERIRSFIHDKFQQVALPRFIRSVQVHSFDFGTIPPDLEVKDICEPFADFYEEDEDDETSDVGDATTGKEHGSLAEDEHLDDPMTSGHPLRLPPRMRERRPEDFQVLCHAKYAGDVRLSLTAEILLDYPMPSFVGLPLKLNVTGITFDGVAVIAYIRKRVHFCFLSAEDADALIGSDQQEARGQDDRPWSSADPTASPKRQGGLLREIRVESEIGRKEDGKQVLKNVGKVERFVLAQVRRIFEEEMVFPSFWTFLI